MWIGTGDASKSTIYRQLHYIYANRDENCDEWRARILNGVMNALNLCIQSIREEGLEFELLESDVSCHSMETVTVLNRTQFSASRIELSASSTFDAELILSEVKQLLADRTMHNAIYRGADRSWSQTLKMDLDDLLMSNNID